MLSKEEKRHVSNLWDAGLSPVEISEDVLNARFFRSLRTMRKEVEEYLKGRDL